VSSPGARWRDHRAATPRAIAGNTGPPRIRRRATARRRDPWSRRGGQHPADPSATTPAARLTREEDEVDRPVGDRTEDDRQQPTPSPATTSKPAGMRAACARECARWRMATTTRIRRRPSRGTRPDRSVAASRTAASDGSSRFALVQPGQSATPVKTIAPVPAATNPEAARVRSAAPGSSRSRLSPRTGERRDQRPPNSAATAAKAPRGRGAELLSPPCESADRERAEPEPERDQRRLGAENESEPRRRERCGRML
jgi:hypothetical protein